MLKYLLMNFENFKIDAIPREILIINMNVGILNLSPVLIKYSKSITIESWLDTDYRISIKLFLF